MSGKVWMSSVLSNLLIIDQGIRTKHYGHDWEEARINGLNAPDEAFDARRRNQKGTALERKDFPEASAVWNEKMYAKVCDIFPIGTAHVVRGKLAETLARFDLGEGGLIPFQIYKADLVTPMEGAFFLLNFGARKNSVLPEQSENVVKGGVRVATGQQLWDVSSCEQDSDLAFSPAALNGADLWFEDIIRYDKIFMSDALAQALIAIDMKDLFALKECRVVEAGQ